MCVLYGQAKRGKLYMGYVVLVKWFLALLIGIGEIFYQLNLWLFLSMPYRNRLSRVCSYPWYPICFKLKLFRVNFLLHMDVWEGMEFYDTNFLHMSSSNLEEGRMVVSD